MPRGGTVLFGFVALGTVVGATLFGFSSPTAVYAAETTVEIGSANSAATATEVQVHQLEDPAALRRLSQLAAEGDTSLVVLRAEAGSRAQARALLAGGMEAVRVALASAARATVVDAEDALASAERDRDAAALAITEYEASKGPVPPGLILPEVTARLDELQRQRVTVPSGSDEAAAIDGEIASQQQQWHELMSAAILFTELTQTQAAADRSVERATADLATVQARLDQLESDGGASIVSSAPLERTRHERESWRIATAGGIGVIGLVLALMLLTPRPSTALSATDLRAARRRRRRSHLRYRVPAGEVVAVAALPPAEPKRGPEPVIDLPAQPVHVVDLTAEWLHELSASEPLLAQPPQPKPGTRPKSRASSRGTSVPFKRSGRGRH